jgi:hypothetical protein
MANGRDDRGCALRLPAESDNVKMLSGDSAARDQMNHCLNALVAVLATAVLSGCASNQAQSTQGMNAAAQTAPKDSDAKCRTFGAEPGTELYKRCRARLDGT